MRTFTRTTLATTAVAALLTAASVGVAHAAPAGGQQAFQLHYNSQVSDQLSQVIGHGPIAGVGTDVEDMDDNGGQAVFTFPNGSVVVDVSSAGETMDLNLNACHAVVTLAGDWTIDHGTGAYAGATGEGTYSGTRTIFGTRIKGVCQGPDSGVEPRMETSDVLLDGSVSLG
ncbi:hypothetical protein GCM10011492_23530 [Flexivirga endophytica]|uniref:Uncharacterized protein n=1 Tax=Flexivirga endophytica TaxID=1849103 RepID=A0A916T6J8_9MICO|nr:hypothetical protein [Flexivirga endophytica]GGB32143.1 hypothetical protein GCM10011492_23530 [Flexivirga endophytica]GHB53083.1 hypothetical protein GCM10008112_22810 [Flexivirga endophytica]